MKIGRWSDWLLRLKTDSFLMLVNKETNEYVNLYANDLKNKEHIKHMALLLDKHKNYVS